MIHSRREAKWNMTCWTKWSFWMKRGNPPRFSHILTFLYEGERYIALSPLEEEASEEEAEVVLLHVVRRGRRKTYVTIESEVLLQEVFAHFLALMDEIQEGEALGENIQAPARIPYQVWGLLLCRKISGASSWAGGSFPPWTCRRKRRARPR